LKCKWTFKLGKKKQNTL